MDRIQHRRNGRADRIPDGFKGVLDTFQNRREECDNGVPDRRDFFVYPIHRSADENLDRLKNRLKQIAEGLKQRGDKFVDGVPNCGDDRPDRIQYSGDCCMNGVPHRRDNKADQLDAVPDLVPIAGEDADKNVQNIEKRVCHELEDICNLLKYTLKDRFQELAKPIPYRLDDLGDVLEIKAQRIQPVNNALTKALKNALDLLPDRRHILPEFLVRIPQVPDGSDHHSNDRHDRKDRTRNAADRTAESGECRLCACNDRRQIRDELHQLADTDHRFADHDQKRTQRRSHQSDLDNGLLRGGRHSTQLVNEHLNLGDDSTNGGHQNFTEGNGKLLKLRFQNGDLSLKVVLHHGSHLFSDTVVAVDLVGTGSDCPLQLFNVCWCSVHQRKEAGHGVLADQRLRCICLLRFGELREGRPAVRKNVIQLTHALIVMIPAPLLFA